LVADLHHNIGAALGGCGDTTAAVDSHRLALAELTLLGLSHKRVYPLGALCERLLDLGRLDDADDTLRELGAAVNERSEPAVRAHATHLAVRVALARADPAGARASAQAGLELARREGLRSYEAQALLDLTR